MIVGILRVELYIPASQSLKEKRMVLRSLKDKTKKKYNVSVAEVNYQDKWQRSEIAFAALGVEKFKVEEILNTIFRVVDSDLNFEVTHYEYLYK